MKELLKKHVINARGQKVKGRYLVIESDDWGSIRIPSLKAQKYLEQEGLINLNDAFSAYDCLESGTDYEELFKVLKSVKDRKGNHPIITANMVLANPAFEQIRAGNFESFEWEPFYETYKSYYPSEETFESFKYGVIEKLILPQFHALAHLNHYEWLQRLRQNDRAFLKAFDLKCFAIDDKSSSNARPNLMAAYDYQTEEELDLVKNSIVEGIQLFEQTFGFLSKTTVAPCYVWNDHIENVLNHYGVKSFQSSHIQRKNSNGQHEFIWQWMGRRNKLNQKYFVRNVLFEPALNEKINWVDKAIESISVAFFWGKPAIVGSHRINYVAGLSEVNRNNSLEQLEELFKRVLKRWPDTEFINSEQLLELYS